MTILKEANLQLGDYERSGPRKVHARMRAVVSDSCYTVDRDELADFTVLTTQHVPHPYGGGGYGEGFFDPDVKRDLGADMEPILSWMRSRRFRAGEAYMFDDRRAGYNPSWSKTKCHWLFHPSRSADALLFKLTYGGAQ